ncbi:hypothetical protein QBC45DRAFT_416363 [Copromyces sp. CBS 386.78]|nr:hypothetical protein QBC45DRAFT_416363 [Copromyces sp. CBS 386.78]
MCWWTCEESSKTATDQLVRMPRWSRCLLLTGRGMLRSVLTTVEFDPKHVEVARKNIAYVIQGSGLEVLNRLKKEIEEGKRPKFGFFFIDADKPNNLNYFNLVEGVAKDERVESMVMQTVGEKSYDACLWAILKSDA